MGTKVSIIWAVVRTTFKGTHRWPNAPEDHPHSYLRNTHRHLFHVTVWVEQKHDDRDIEYLEFKDWLDDAIQKGDMDYLSCEMMAIRIKELVENHLVNKANHPVGAIRKVKVEVSEDGENGALVE